VRRVKVETPTEKEDKKQVEFTWKLHELFEKSIQQSYIDAINHANRFIYIETQYFIGSGAHWDEPDQGARNQIPERIVKKIQEKLEHGQEFHAYIIIPMYPEGDPVAPVACVQRFFEWQTMQYMVKAVAAKAETMGKDWNDFLSFYFLANWSDVPDAEQALVGERKTRVAKNKRYMIYVHSKLMIVDDEYLITGSANLNERSLAGDRDSEICLYLRPPLPAEPDGQVDQGKRKECIDKIRALRRTAWTQHLGTLPPDFEAPEKASCSSDMRSRGRDNWIKMREMRRAGASHLIAFPFYSDGNVFSLLSITPIPDLNAQDTFLFDAAAKQAGPPGNGSTIDSQWQWDSPHTTLLTKYLPPRLAE